MFPSFVHFVLFYFLRHWLSSSSSVLASFPISRGRQWWDRTESCQLLATLQGKLSFMIFLNMSKVMTQWYFSLRGSIYLNASFLIKYLREPWLVWLSGLSASLKTKGSPVRFQVRAHALVCGPGHQSGTRERQPHSVSLPLFLPPFPSLKINK